jgi:hypothetical protein
MAERPATPPRRPAAGGQRPAGAPKSPGAGTGPPRVGGLPISAVIVIVIAVAVLIWLLFIRGGDDNNSNSEASKRVDLISAPALPNETADVAYPVYWLGPKPGVEYEVTLISDGRTYIRYLPTGVEAQSPDPYLTVGSYEQANAYDVLKGLAKRPGQSTVTIPNGGLALRYQGKSNGIYAAFPGDDTQIEIFDPTPGKALDFAKSGALAPVG